MKLTEKLAWALVLALVTGAAMCGATRDDRKKINVAVATTKLAALAPVPPKSVKMAKRHVRTADKPATNLKQVTDHVLLVAVDKDGIVHTTDVVDKALVAGKSLVTVTVNVQPDSPGVGAMATLIASPKQKGFTAQALDVAIVRVRKTDSATSYTVALTPDDLKLLAPLLGVAEIRVVPRPITI